MTRSEAIQIAVDQVVTTRDMCGDELQAIRDVQDDLHIRFTPGELGRIAQEVRNVWQDCQAAAGVVPEKRLSMQDRMDAERALESTT